MIKVYLCKTKITTPFISRNSKREGYYKSGEYFLMYLNPKGTWVATSPINSTTKSKLVGLVNRMDTKYCFLQNMNYVQIVDLIFVDNKKQLNYFIERFKGEEKLKGEEYHGYYKL